MQRSGRARLDAILPSIAAGEAFRARVAEAEGDVTRCADLMAEAIEIHRGQRGLEVVGHDGRQTMAVEELQAMHCLDAARDAYLRARGSNSRLTHA